MKPIFQAVIGTIVRWQQEIDKRLKEVEVGSRQPDSWAEARTTITGK